MPVILLVEDDLTIAKTTQSYLIQNGFDTSHVTTLKDANLFLKQHPVHILLLDMMLPDGNALDFYQTINPLIKVVFLTAVDDERIIIDTLQNGIEDYVTKPFRLPILLAKLRNIVTRYRIEQSNAQQYYHLMINAHDQTIFENGSAIHLSATEQRLFFYLFANRGTTLTREQILTYMWDNSGEFVNDNTLTVTLRRLRSKIEKDLPLIETFRGVGYCLRRENNAITS